MSVWKVREIFKGRKGGLSEGVERKYTRVFQVFTTSKLNGPIDIMFATDGTESIPELYSGYFSYLSTESDPLALCRSIDPVQDDDDWTVWTVTCEYSTESPRGDQAGQLSAGNSPGDPRTGGGATGDPTLESPVEEWSSWSREVAQEIEAPFGLLPFPQNPICNSAGSRFDPMPTRELTGDILVIERNESTDQYDPYLVSLYRNHVNATDFIWEGDYNEWLCKSITAKKVWKGNHKYYRVRYEFHHCGEELATTKAEDGQFIAWDHGILDVGFEEIVDDKRKPIMRLGQMVSTPWPLRDGRALTVAEIEEGQRTTLYFLKYSRADFGPLNIILE